MTDMRKMFRATLCAGLLAWSTTGSAQYGSDFCQILDRFDEPIWQAYASYADSARIDGFRHFSMLEMGAASGLIYFRTEFGEFDLKAAVDSIFFSDSGGVRLPSNVTAARLDMNYVIRLEDGYALRLGIEPGLYSEIAHVNSDHFFYPFSIHGLRAFTPNLSGLAGLNIYPGFDRLVDPRLGLRWAISDYLLMDVAYPKSEVVFRPNFEWALRAGVEIREYLEYQLKRSDDRKRLMLDETRIYIGADYLLTDQIQLMARIGRIVNRSIDFRRFEQEKDVDDAYFVRIGIGGLI